MSRPIGRVSFLGEGGIVELLNRSLVGGELHTYIPVCVNVKRASNHFGCDNQKPSSYLLTMQCLADNNGHCLTEVLLIIKFI